jgi:integrase/recombinase XerC
VLAYRRDLQEFMTYCSEEFDSAGIDMAEYGMIRSWIVRHVNGGLTNRTVNRKIASLKAYYRFLLKVEVITVSPLRKHRALKTSKSPELPFSENEMVLVEDVLPIDNTFDAARDRLLVELLYTTGIRRAELINLKISDVDLHELRIKVLGKRNKERILPLLKTTAALFTRYLTLRKGLEIPGVADYVFLSNSGNKMYETLVYRIINGYFSKVSSKVKKSPHILRHTFATHLLNNGADLNSVKELLGHTSLASTQVYTHNSIAELKRIHAKAHPRSEE